MNKEKIVNNMISYIQNAEKNLQISKLSNDSKIVKTDIVKSILNELEKEMKDEN